VFRSVPIQLLTQRCATLRATHASLEPFQRRADVDQRKRRDPDADDEGVVGRSRERSCASSPRTSPRADQGQTYIVDDPVVAVLEESASLASSRAASSARSSGQTASP
jgi:hypothetical protein